MRRFVLALILLATPSLAQEQEFTIKLRATDVNALGNALDQTKAPHDDVARLINVIKAQIQAQVAPQVSQAPTEEKK